MKKIFTVFVLILLLSYVELSAQGGKKPLGGTPPPPTSGNPPTGGGQEPSFDDVDANHDGRISMDEAKAKFGNDPDWQAKFDKHDANNDGYVGKAEYPQQGPPPTGTPPAGTGYNPAGTPQGPSFEDVDTDKDGKISWTEAKAKFGHEADWGAKFSARDKNKDGVIDRSEF